MARQWRDLRGDGEFNPPDVMLARFAYLIAIASIPTGIVLLAAAALLQRWQLGGAGLAALSLAWVTCDSLKRRGKFEAAAGGFEAIAGAEPTQNSPRLARLVELLREWDRLENQRHSPGFDPWALQAVRNDIAAVIDDDPDLAALFRAHRRAA